MSEGKTVPLRIYCICGQKMKVSGSMYGRPGKCVACRQKIRIPTPDEIPPDATEIHLKDHPEFLRKPALAVMAPADAEPHRAEEAPDEAPKDLGPLEDIVSEPDVVPLGSESPRDVSVPLDVFEPLRVLASLRAKLRRQQETLGGLEETVGGGSKRAAELAGQRARVKRARMEFDDFLRQRLMDTAIELATVQEKLAELSLAVRVGEMDFAGYRAAVEPLRRRRDRLERRQQNLRGWLAVQDPYMAGGYVDASPDQALADKNWSLPREPETDEGLLEEYVRELRQALERRERAERKASEAVRMPAGKDQGPAPLNDMRADCAAALKRVRAAATFYAQRIEQVQSDYRGDLDAIEAQLDLARGRLQVGEIDRTRFDRIEADLLRAKMDLSKALDLAKRALLASGAGDVPSTRGTYLRRMAPPTDDRDGGRAAPWLGWIAAVGLLASLFLPLADGLSPLRAYGQAAGFASPGFAAVLGPGLAALIALVAGFIPSRSARGVAYCGAWLATLLAVLALIAKDMPLLRPAPEMWVASALLLVIASIIALWPSPGLRFLPLGAFALLAAAGAVVLAAPTTWNGIADRLVGPGETPAQPIAGLPASIDTAEAEPAPPTAEPVSPEPDPAPGPADLPAASDSAGPEPADEADGPAEEPAPPDSADAWSVRAELQGVLSSPDRPPRFSIVLRLPGQPPRTHMYAIGDTLYGQWVVAEHNAATQTVTLADAEGLLIMRRGTPVVLEEIARH